MASFNHVTLCGNCTRDPQTKFLPSQVQVTEWGMAVSRKFKTAAGELREDVLFIECAAFKGLAKVAGDYLQKGKPVLVSGRLKLDSWEDKNGGGNRSKISVVVENLQLLGSRNDGQGGKGGQRRDEADQGDGGDPQHDQTSAADDSFPADPSSIPF